jgi:uncharacterized protein
VQLKLLWELQELDLSIRKLDQKIENAPLQSGVDETEQEVEEEKNTLGELENQLKADRKTMRQLEMDTQKIDDDRKELTDNLYSGKVTNVKELEQMHRKLDLLAAEKKKLEDKIIVLMESIEEQEKAIADLDSKLQGSVRELEKKKNTLVTDLERFKAERVELEAKRNLQADKIEPKYMSKYNILAGKNQGKALAMVTNDLCGGCKVFISSGLSGRLYNQDAMVYCENCGRLLVRFDD